MIAFKSCSKGPDKEHEMTPHCHTEYHCIRPESRDRSSPCFSLLLSLSYVLFGTPSRMELIGVVGVSLSFIKLGPSVLVLPTNERV